MVPRVRIDGIPAGTTAQEAQAILQSSRHTRYPIYQGDLDHIVGIIHIKTLAHRLIAHQGIEASDAHAVPFVPETAPLNSVLATMHRYRTQIAIIMDEHGGTAGLVTVEDLFQEVVGEIKEDMAKPPKIYRDLSGRLCVSGTTRIEELSEQLAVVLQHEEVDTVSGLILAQLGRPAVVGDAVEYQGVRFEVTAVEGHGVKECIVSTLACVDEACEIAGLSHEEGA
jgi:CBS domain containing-hemolysin-like protein